MLPGILDNMLNQGFSIAETQDISDLEEQLLDDQGRLKPCSAEFLRSVPHQKLVYFCNTKGFYSIPTYELLDKLRGYLPENDLTIEIGAGNGVYGRELGVKMTDNYQQHPKNERKFKGVVASYMAVGQALVPYGDDVIELDAKTAVQNFKPHTILGAWVTQKYNPRKPHMKGNMHGVPYQWIYSRKHVRQLILIGNKNVHSNVEILKHDHVEIECKDILFSRALQEGNDRIYIWQKD